MLMIDDKTSYYSKNTNVINLFEYDEYKLRLTLTLTFFIILCFTGK